MTICAVAWDIDGTLVDSEPVHLLALKATSRQFDIDISDLPDDQFIGVNMTDVWNFLRRRFPKGFSNETFLNSINENYLTETACLRSMPGALEAVSELRAAGLRQVAVSNSARPIVHANLAIDGLADFVEFSVSLDDVASGKPDPEPYLRAAEALGLSPACIVAVEDSNTGAQSALAAGARLIGYNLDNGPVAKTARYVSDLGLVADLIVQMSAENS